MTKKGKSHNTCIHLFFAESQNKRRRSKDIPRATQTMPSRTKLDEEATEEVLENKMPKTKKTKNGTKKKTKKEIIKQTDAPTPEELEELVASLIFRVNKLEDDLAKKEHEELNRSRASLVTKTDSDSSGFSSSDSKKPDPKNDATKEETGNPGVAYPAFEETTHRWLIFGNEDNEDDSSTSTHRMELWIGLAIIFFQLWAYLMIWLDNLQTFKEDLVPVMVSWFHSSCHGDGILSLEDINLEATNQLQCESQESPIANYFLVAGFVAIFLTLDFEDLYLAFQKTRNEGGSRFFFAFVAIEVIVAFVTCVVSGLTRVYNGSVVEGLEVGVGLLFVHEMGNRIFESVKENQSGSGRDLKLFLSTFCVVYVVAILLGVTFIFGVDESS